MLRLRDLKCYSRFAARVVQAVDGASFDIPAE